VHRAKTCLSQIPVLNHANDLVSRDYGRFLRNQFSFNDVEVGPADAAIRNTNQYFPICCRWGGNVCEDQGVGFYRGGRLEDAGFHGRGTPHRVFFEKRLQVTENKRRDVREESKEAAIARKQAT